jgi:LytS/YehU family sensor histidine kinase
VSKVSLTRKVQRGCAKRGKIGPMRHLAWIGGLLLGFFAVAVLVARLGNSELLVALLSLAVVVPLAYLVVDRFNQRFLVQRLREEALRAEVTLLKAQIDPHFFFNTLNNLYGLAVARSEHTAELILKLSELMRFTIYEGRKDHVALRDELEYLRNYLAIQRLRSRVEVVDLRFEAEVEDDMVMVPPLLLILLVENAIKHGVGSKTDGAFVHIKLAAGDDWLEFRVVNNYEEMPQRPRGIGLANLERRLALLFPGRHRFERDAVDGVFTATLRLEL